jgi:hypothetical protein
VITVGILNLMNKANNSTNISREVTISYLDTATGMPWRN